MADDSRAVAFGRRLFFDERLSGSGAIACSTCHQPERAFTDGQPRGRGAGEALRNTPTLLGVAFNRWFYWDGRRDSLWAQALVPFEAPGEMGSTRVKVLRIVASDPEYREAYEELFGPLPPGAWLHGLPRQAGPFGDRSSRDEWQRLSAKVRDQINAIYANLGKVLEAYERTLMPNRSRFDAFVDVLTGGETTSAATLLSKEEELGLRIFIREESLCLRCHNGIAFSNGGFHNIGTGNRRGDALDFGRAFGIQSALVDEFNCLGPHSDAEEEDCDALRFLDRGEIGHLEGAFKVPTLRHVSETAPYFHDGRFRSLEEVVAFYNEPNLEVDGVELVPLRLSDEEQAALVSFLKVL